MDFISILLISLGLAMDAFGVSIAKGLTLNTKGLFKNAIIIAFLFGLFQAFMPFIAYYASIHFSVYIIALDHWIAFSLLSGIGLHMIKEAKQTEHTSIIKIDYIPFKQLLLLAIATSIDAFVVGISFAFLEINVVLACSCIGFITFIVCILGVFIGKYIGNSMQSYANYFGGILLISLGIKTLIQHLWIG